MNGIESVFFDAGNTLVFLDCDAIAELAAEYGARPDAAALRELDFGVRHALDRGLLARVEGGGEIEQGTVSMGSQDLWSRFFRTLLERAGVAPEHSAEIAGRLRDHDRADPRGLWHRVEEDTEAVLAQLRRRGCRLGVISNSDGRLADKLREVGLAPYFEVVVDSAAVGVEKPDPRIFHLGLAALGTPAARSLYVGDIYAVDVLGARRAGMQAALFDGAGCYQGFEGPVLRRLADLLELVH